MLLLKVGYQMSKNINFNGSKCQRTDMAM